MRCPLLVIAYPNELGEQVCSTDECAWWIPSPGVVEEIVVDQGSCAIHKIATSEDDPQ